MNPIAELIVVKYNTRKNAYEGSRNEFTKIDVDDVAKIKETITTQFNTTLAESVGSVLVKYDGKLFICERDTVNPKNIYTRHQITYHPYNQQFTL